MSAARWSWMVLCAGLALALLAPVAPMPRGAAQEETIPRLVLALYDSSEARPDSELIAARTNLVHALAEMPLQFLGVRLQYLDVQTERLPSAAEMRRYRGVISWFQDDKTKDAVEYLAWLREQISAGRRVVILGSLGAGTDGTGAEVPAGDVQATYEAMGLTPLGGIRETDNPLVIRLRRKAPEMVEFERSLDNELTSYTPVRSVAPTNQVYLTLFRADQLNSDSDLVVTGPWGGFVSSGYEYYYQPQTFEKRWRLNPFLFFEEAFALQGLPRPDVSTLNGSRVFYTHVDGDGFNNISEVDYTSLSAELLLERFYKRYDLPFTVSIVVSDIDPAVLGGSRQLRVARETFALPNVEPASHTYTHPFDWGKPVQDERELRGAIEFLNGNVVAPGRPVTTLLWSGATNPRAQHIARANQLGVLHINGGDGRFDPERDSYASFAPLTTQVGQLIQYYTSNSNDNIYGNDWTGPYYGLRNVITTWDRTESPRRIGALNVYIHTFSAEKHASLRALQEVYDDALRREIAPVFTSDYIRMVDGFLTTEISRADPSSWRIKNYGILRTIRFDSERRFPDLARSQNVIGYQHHQGSLYVFLGEAGESLIALSGQAPTQPYVGLASQRVLDWSVAGNSISLAMEGIGRKRLELRNLAPDAEFDVREVGREQRDSRTRTDPAGRLFWASDSRGRVALTVAPASPPVVSGIPVASIGLEPGRRP